MSDPRALVREILTTGRLDGLVISPILVDGEVALLDLTVDSLPGARLVVEIAAARELRDALVAILGPASTAEGAPATEYAWRDAEGHMWSSPLVDHAERGRCSGIPECCVAHYLSGGSSSFAASHWGYVACPSCVASGLRVEVRHCEDRKDACSCGQWRDRRPLDGTAT